MISGPLATIEVAKGSTSREAWRKAGIAGADRLFSNFPFARNDPNPGSLVYLQFDLLDETDDLRLAAIGGFDDRWRELVPGWEPEIPVKEVLA